MYSTNPIREETTLDYLPRMPLFSNYHRNTEGVKGIYVSYHYQPSWETTEVRSPLHIITLPTVAPTQAQEGGQLDRWMDGKRQTRQTTEDMFDFGITVIPVDTLHRASWNREVEFMMITIEPWSIAQISHELIDPDSVELVPQFNTPDPQIHRLGLLLKSELISPGHCSDIYMDSLKTILMVNLLRRHTTCKNKLQEDTGRLTKRKLMQVIEYVNENLAEELSLQEIASELKMSPGYFTRLFKQSTGIPAYQYVMQCRIRRAKELLRWSDLTIIDISLRIGFQCQSHFAKVFRKQVGVNPMEYRRLF
jgi:AraC family transcriptional regulator